MQYKSGAPVAFVDFKVSWTELSFSLIAIIFYLYELYILKEFTAYDKELLLYALSSYNSYLYCTFYYDKLNLLLQKLAF
jgi:hypothetical protein